MNFELNDEERAFRDEVREFLDKELPVDWPGYIEQIADNDEEWEFTLKMAKKLGEKGWLSMTWPKEYGGKELPLLYQFIFNEELHYRYCPGRDLFGVGMLAPTLLKFGTDEQKKKHLPGIGSGEVFWCELLSEPGAGSDLAALQTKAVERDDCYEINGQKVWNSGAHRADWAFILTRTDPELPRHRGLSFFLLDMKTPGVTVRPLRNMAGYHEFNEVFLDEVKIPKENMIGEKNRGWYVTMALLDFERSAIDILARSRRLLELIIRYAKETKVGGKPLSEDPLVRRKLAELSTEVEIGRLLAYRFSWMESRGMDITRESSVVKSVVCGLGQRVPAAGMEILGLYSQLTGESKWAPIMGWVERMYLRCIGHTLEEGTSEIMLNLIAQRGLGLPRE